MRSSTSAGVPSRTGANRRSVSPEPKTACGAGPCTDGYAVTVDGTPVPSAAATRIGSDDLHMTLLGVTAPLTGGSHTIELTQTDAGATESQVVLGGIVLQ